MHPPRHNERIDSAARRKFRNACVCYERMSTMMRRARGETLIPIISASRDSRLQSHREDVRIGRGRGAPPAAAGATGGGSSGDPKDERACVQSASDKYGELSGTGGNVVAAPSFVKL